MADYSSFFNEAGEPLMSGEQMRQEMYYDAFPEYDPGDYYEDWSAYDDDEPFCKRCGDYGHEADECEEDFSDWEEPSFDTFLGEE